MQTQMCASEDFMSRHVVTAVGFQRFPATTARSMRHGRNMGLAKREPLGFELLLEAFDGESASSL
ncbi:hypothetical protein CIT31_13850 [Mesorhizobium wenxiniae]|uniref:Uncharacterized protein n=1 Tax=Mesorhizobium wenxiniae TaxID=2014805 RepID=A0A271KHA9_9HYPH|nr:hypothetical protein CIT31_13850 [Mesorhizobium wenxiniae]